MTASSYILLATSLFRGTDQEPNSTKIRNTSLGVYFDYSTTMNLIDTYLTFIVYIDTNIFETTWTQIKMLETNLNDLCHHLNHSTEFFLTD